MFWKTLGLALAVTMLHVESQMYILPYPPDNRGHVCRNPEREYYRSMVHRCCSQCPPGTRLIEDCTETKDTVCQKCRNGSYTDRWHYHNNCFRCTKACYQGLEEVQPCTVTSPRKCVCKGGYCSFTSSSYSCDTCSMYSSCPPGQGVSEKGTANSDVVCSPCPPGTFSATDSSTEICQPHTDCASHGTSELRAGTNSADAVCHPKMATTPPRAVAAETLGNSVLHRMDAPFSARPPSLPHSVPTTVQADKTVAVIDKTNIIAGAVAGGAVLVTIIIVMFIIGRCIYNRTAALQENADAEAKKVLNCTPGALQRNSSGNLHPPSQERLCLLGETESSQSELSSALGSQSGAETTTSSSQRGSPSCCQDSPQATSPQLKVNFQATISCHLPTNTHCCSPPRAEGVGYSPEPYMFSPNFPLSQEETSISQCQDKDNKDARPAVQEVGKAM
uniref:Tumor necrosis factor receptor superfamily, member 1B n=1 Tax=Lepisosteus oculatus TaxID=7918 RepID=W5M9R3_LEPOC|nr:PREDICTED: tumor necrosis factor receptor superfamily member 1B-like isoform X2 [Lepisosteus oculatus]WFD54359.1 tumor necrosis factor receptor superfamily member 1B [Lepisosteus oculatus]